MRTASPTGARFVGLLFVALLSTSLRGQELAPRAYLITPTGSNAITLSSSIFSGDLNLPGELPLQDASGIFTVQTVTYYRSFSLLGHSANVAVGLPYGIGNFEGTLESGNVHQAYRSGLLDTGVRFAFNLRGGPAMPLSKFMKWKQGMLLGVSLRVVPPTGQYIPGRLINWSINRWGFKPEFGYSQRWGKWILDGSGGVWLFTANPQAFAVSEPKYQTLSPILSLEGHLSYDVRRRLWFSLDGNFWTGGTATVNGISNPQTKQTSARIGGTASLPLNQRQSLKLSYSHGAYVRFGGDYQNVTVAWQYAWISKSR
jgi:Putative MetA-pathway of phenol degradation